MTGLQPTSVSNFCFLCTWHPELSAYHRRLLGSDSLRSIPQATGKQLTPHCLQALSYARVASIVRGCAYSIMPDVHPGDLPFVGAAQARKIRDILRMGTTPALEAHR